MTAIKYEAPECGIYRLASESLICDSGNADGERYGNGTDYGGKNLWEGTKW